jgi:metal-sulfur cluster biosynthetic enzyme
VSEKTETIKLTRDVTATLVPFGEEITLTAGTEVTIAQSLGGTFTVVANYQMLRIANKDADALGKKVASFDEMISKYTKGRELTVEEKVWFQLSTCYDPEIPVNIVDLGLIYQVAITQLNSPKKPGRKKKTSTAGSVSKTVTQKYDVLIKMTLTAPGCGMGPIIVDEAKQKVLAIPEVNNVEIEIVFDPPWDRSRMSDQAKLELGLF